MSKIFASNSKSVLLQRAPFCYAGTHNLSKSVMHDNVFLLPSSCIASINLLDREKWKPFIQPSWIGELFLFEIEMKLSESWNMTCIILSLLDDHWRGKSKPKVGIRCSVLFSSLTIKLLNYDGLSADCEIFCKKLQK